MTGEYHGECGHEGHNAETNIVHSLPLSRQDEVDCRRGKHQALTLVRIAWQ